MPLTHALQPPAPHTGLYSSPGWLEASGVYALMTPLIDSVIPRDFARFSGINATHADRLLTLLPSGNLLDQQNQAPPVQRILTLVRTRPDVSAGGYMIRSPRWDERLSIDSVTWETSEAAPYVGASYAHIMESGVWDNLAATLGISEYRPPDECEALPFLSPGRGCGWWLWWD